jgi:hypothetical protein
VNHRLVRIWKEAWRFFIGISLEGLGKPTKSLSRYNCCSGLDTIQVPPKYKSRVLLLDHPVQFPHTKCRTRSGINDSLRFMTMIGSLYQICVVHYPLSEIYLVRTTLRYSEFLGFWTLPIVRYYENQRTQPFGY